MAVPLMLNFGLRSDLLKNSSNSSDRGSVTLKLHSAISTGLPLSAFALSYIFSFHFAVIFSDFSIRAFLSSAVLMFSASFLIFAFSSTN